MDTDKYQRRIVVWHARRWPNATHDRVAMKLGEETGEVLEARCKEQGEQREFEEITDVLNVCAVLLNRLGRTMSEALAYGVTVEERKKNTYGD